MLCRNVVPKGFRLTGKKTILTIAQREDALRRVAAGESQVSVAKEFHVTRSAITLLKQRTANPERYANKYDLKKRLTPEETATFKQALETSLPKDHGLDVLGSVAMHRWTMDRAYALADKLFKRQPSVRVMKECLGKQLACRPDDDLSPTRPTQPMTRLSLTSKPARSSILPDPARSPIPRTSPSPNPNAPSVLQKSGFCGE